MYIKRKVRKNKVRSLFNLPGIESIPRFISPGVSVIEHDISLVSSKLVVNSKIRYE
jgi:hypothetical protein